MPASTCVGRGGEGGCCCGSSTSPALPALPAGRRAPSPAYSAEVATKAGRLGRESRKGLPRRGKRNHSYIGRNSPACRLTIIYHIQIMNTTKISQLLLTSAGR